jgi:uncharacterized protein DUF4382/uncharacterized protein DUF5666
MKTTRLFTLSLASLLVCLPLSCGGGGGSSASSSADASVGFLVGDAPTDGLSSFTVEITEMRMRKASGELTANLLSGPRTHDVLGLGLSNREALLQFGDVPSGSYEGVFLKLSATTLDARDLAGLPISINPGVMQAEANFSSTNNSALSLTDDGYASVSVDIVLDQCLSPAAGSGFNFNLVLRSSHTKASPKLDDFTGRVTGINRNAKFFNVEVIDARHAQSTFGAVQVQVDDTDQLFQFTGAEFGNSNAFLANLKTGDLVEIEGALTSRGVFDADRCEIEDRGSNRVRIEGRLLSVDLNNQSLELLWEEIERGYDHARGVLVSLGDPGVLDVMWDNRTHFLGSRGSSNLGPADLVPGQKLEIHFNIEDFAAPMPFYASKMRIDGEQRYEGDITDISGLPGSFLVEIDQDHPGVHSGRITEPITVEIQSNTVLFLDTGVSPNLQAGDLLPNLKLKLSGQLTGSGSQANLNAERIEVEAGRLEAVVVSVDPVSREIGILITRVKDPFGGTEPFGSITAVVDSQAVIEFDDDEHASFNDLRVAFNSLSSGESLEIELEGIGDGSGQVRAFEIEAKTESDS